MNTIERGGIILAILAGYVLRAFRIDYQELRGDEAFGYFFSQNTYPQIVSETLSLQEPHPALSYWLLKAWISASGDSEFALRYIGALFSVLAIAFLFRLAWEIGLPIRIAILAAILLAISPYAVWHSQDARMYSMSMALTLANALTAVLWLKRPQMIPAVLYVLTGLAALFVHYFAAFILVALNLFVLTQLIAGRISSATLGRWALIQAMLALLYAPWLFFARTILAGYRGNGDSPVLFEALLRAASVFAAGETVLDASRPIWAGVGIALVCLGLVACSLESRHRPAAWLFGLYMMVPVLATWFGAQTRPIFDERYLVAAAPAFYALAASALLLVRTDRSAGARLSEMRYAGIAALVLLSSLAVGSTFSLVQYFNNPVYSKTRGWRDLAGRLDRLSACLHPDEVRLVQNYPDPTLWYYYDGPVRHLVLPPAAHDAVLANSEIDAMSQEGVGWVIFVDQPSRSWDDKGIALSALDGKYERLALDASTNWPVHLYAAPSDPTPLSARFSNGVQLEAYSLAPAGVLPGGALSVQLHWDLSQMADQVPLKAFVHVLDSSGDIVAQHDAPLVSSEANALPNKPNSFYGILLPNDASSGEYEVIAGLYRPTAESERLLLGDGADYVKLGVIQVLDLDGETCREVNAP